METIWKITALAMVTAVLSVLLRQNSRVLSVLLSLSACVGILLLGLAFLSPVRLVIDQLRRLSGLSDWVTAPLFKVAAMGLLTHLCAEICINAGETALAKAVEISGTALSVYASLPLLSAVLTLLEELLGGMG